MITITEFCDRYHACYAGRYWAIANCDSLQRAWDTAPAEWLIWAATRPGVLADRELRMFSFWSVRQVWHLLADGRSRNAVEVAERHADTLATDEDLAAARAAAWNAAWAAARAAARDAVWDAAWDAARAAARAAAWDAARNAARAAAGDAARAAARDAQASYLRSNCRPVLLFG